MPALGLSLGLPFGRAASAGASAPDAVTNLVAVAGDAVVSLTWDASVGATGYKVYRNTTNNFGSATLITDPPEATTSFDDSLAQPGELHYYWVVATNAVGDSPESASDSARPYVTLTSLEISNLTTPAGSWMLTTLFFRTGGNLPFGCTVSWNDGADLVASLGDGTWENQLTFEAPYDAAISGAFTFDNQSGGSVTFWDTEP
jgi:hypothetical protein